MHEHCFISLTHSMDGGLNVSTSQEAESVAGVDRQAAIQGLRPLPLPGSMVLDLKRGDGLAEQEGD